MTGADPLREAVAELYSSDPDEFIERRGVLAARARAAGEASLAKSIAALRKPTRSAWVLNQLVRSAPAVSSQLTALGEDLRAAQESLDGAAIRELSLRRRQLIDDLARQAFTVSGQQSPPAALRDEVTATLGAALADPQFAEQLRAGALERAAHRDGFGYLGAAALAVLPPALGPARTPAAARAVAPARTPPAKGAAAPASPAAKATPPATQPATPPATQSAAARARAEQERRRQAITRAEQERRRQAIAAEQERRREAIAAEQERRREVIAAAEQAVAEADRVVDAAARAEQEQDSAVRLIEEQLTAARRRLVDAGLQARQAKARQRRARQALDRLREQPPGAQARPAKPHR